MSRSTKLLLAVLCAVLACAAAAQTFPARAIRVIVPFPAGGTADSIARIVSQRTSENIGQPIVVENRSGANGIVGTEAVAKSAPDGYTLLMAPSGHAINNSLNANVPYDPVKDFQMLTLIGTVPMVAVVNNDFPVKSVRELIDTAKAKPGSISY